MIRPHLINDRDQNVQPRRKQAVEFPEPFDHADTLLGNDFDRQCDKYNNDCNNNPDNDP
ncbi:hypothetical protein D3C85_1710050 [compost metagenome]